MSKRGGSGFTLIELLIVVAVIAVVAAISLPNLLSAKVNANETAAIATVRNLVSAQAQLAVASRIDADSDGKGEHGTLLEMTGTVGVRKGYNPGTGASDFSVKGAALSPPLISSAFSRVDAVGFTTKSGYAFMVFLPDSASPAGFARETGPAASAGFAGGTGDVGTNAAETAWCVYAQPVHLGQTGTRRFFANQKGDLLQSSNAVAKAGGVAAPVQGNAAFLGAGITSAIAVGTAGGDGDIWKVAN